MRDGDAVICFNYRSDRMRQIVRALMADGFDAFDVSDAPRVPVTTMTQYDATFGVPAAFPPFSMARIVAEVLAENGKSTLRTAETEKYPHVTYFFNGGEEKPYAGEVRELVPSPRDVPTYDHKPEMSAREAADAFVEHFSAEKPAFAIINFANPDMVGHTGVIPAAVKAVETVDECLGRVVEAVHAAGGACLVTADHGNCDHMLNDDGSVNTAHSLNPVPFIVTAGAQSLDGRGTLADVAPTALALLGIEQPVEMTGRSLLG
jgi:2,3-bisphosphoglycerate-independent phosphoglycerate mutase